MCQWGKLQKVSIHFYCGTVLLPGAKFWRMSVRSSAYIDPSLNHFDELAGLIHLTVM